MELKEIMKHHSFAVLGDTLNKEKFACKIKDGLMERGYAVYGVGKERSSINDIAEDIDIVDLCIHPVKGLKLLRECEKPYKCVVIQPGAASEEIIDFLKSKEIDYIEGCLLIGMNKYPSPYA